MTPSRAGRGRSSTAQTVATRSTSHALVALLVVAAGLVTFWNSLGLPFIWDDQTAIVTNHTIQQLWPLSVPLTPPRETPVAGRPVVNLSFAINYALGGLAGTGYHAVNISLHIICGLLLFGIVRRTLITRRISSNLRETADSTAVVIATLWLVHPLQSEVVDYVTQRSESLMGLFFLLTLYSAIRARPAEPNARQKDPRQRSGTGWRVLSVVACACGMASKESMVVAPLVVVLYDWAFEFDSLRGALRQRRMLYAGLIATWSVLAVLIWSAPRSTVGSTAIISPWIYLLNQIEMISRYLRLSVWPDALVLDYGLPRVLAAGDVIPAALVLLALLAGTIVSLVRWPKIGFLAATFFLTLAPTSSIMPIVSEVGAERRMYLAFAALSTLVVVGGRSALNLLGPTAARRYAAASLTVVILAGLAIRTIARNAEYSDPVTLWTTVVNRHPHGRARMSLATELLETGRHAEAIAILREAVSDFPDARAALGTTLILQGQTEEGMAVLRQFIAADPSNVNRIPAYALLAEAMMSRHDFEGAAREWRELARIAPSDQGARAQLARTLSAQAEARLRQSDGPGAEPYAREAVQLAPRDPVPRNLLGAALASTGRMDEAITQFREALQVAPGDTQSQANLERALRLTSTSRPRPRSGESDPR